LRPKAYLLATHVELQTIVASRLILDRSPEQISGWLKIRSPEDESMRVSHETIYRSLFIQARGVLKKRIQHLRSKRRIRRSRLSRVGGQSRGQVVDASSIRERPAEIEDRAIPGHMGGRSAWRHQEQSPRNTGGTTFAFYHVGQSAQQRHSCGRRRAKPARS
jgi:IS30 family transposase